MPQTKLSPGQRTVLEAISNYPAIDDQGLAVHVHHIASNDMSSSGVRTRRSELQSKGLIAVAGSKTTKSGKTALTHTITTAGKRVLASVV